MLIPRVLKRLWFSKNSERCIAGAVFFRRGFGGVLDNHKQNDEILWKNPFPDNSPEINPGVLTLEQSFIDG